MATVKPLFASESTVVSTELNSLANSSSASAGSEVDNTSNRYVDGHLACYFNGAGATTGSVAVYVLEGSTTAELSTTTKTANMRYLGRVELNGTTAVRKLLRFDNVPKFWKLYLTNESGAALAASGNTVKFTGVNYSDS